MGAQDEEEVGAVEDQENDGGTARENQDTVLLLLVAGVVEDVVEGCRDDQGRRREGHHGAGGLSGSRRKSLFGADAVGVAHVDDAAEEEAHSQDEKQVREDGAKHRGLYDLDFAGAEGNDTDLIERNG